MPTRLTWIIIAALVSAAAARFGLRDPSPRPKPSTAGAVASAGARETPRSGETIQGRVVAVLDGDTVTVLDSAEQQHRVRFFGIDAPEKAQAYGQVSKRNLSDLVFNREVVVEVADRDRYGRKVGRIFVDGQDANLLQVRAGLAWAYRQYLKGEHREAYIAAEAEARGARRGLWGDPDPTPPWEWRRRSKSSK